MSEPDSNDVRDLLGTALRGEPPNSVDPARMVRLGRRRVRLQRAGAALGAMVVAAGITLGASLIHQGGGGAGPDRISTAGTSGVSTTSGSIMVTPTPAGRSGAISVTRTPSVHLPNGQRILTAQNQAVAAWILPTGLSVTSGSLAFTPILPSTDTGYSGGQLNARLSDKYGFGDFSLSATVVDTSFNGMTCTDSKMNCQVQLINGVTVEIETDHPTAFTTRVFTVAASGNILVNGEVDNLSSPNGKNATRPTLPLTQDQLAHVTAAVATAGQ
jgi:hypothetical protein